MQVIGQGLDLEEPCQVVYLPGLLYCFDLLQKKRGREQRLPRNATKSSGFVGGVRWLLRCLA